MLSCLSSVPGSKQALFHSAAAKGHRVSEHLSPISHEPARSEQQHPVGINSVITKRRPEKRMVNSVFVECSTAVKMNVPIADNNTEGSRTEEQQAVHVNLPVVDACGRRITRPCSSEALLPSLSGSLPHFRLRTFLWKRIPCCSPPPRGWPLVLFT